MVDIGRHCRRPLRLPGPDGGADIIDDLDFGQRLANLAGNAMAEIRAVDNQQAVRPRGNDRLRGLVDAHDQFG